MKTQNCPGAKALNCKATQGLFRVTTMFHYPDCGDGYITV